jgi:hypothetical protein
LLTEKHKLQQKNVSSQLLEHYAAEGNDFYSMMTADERWFSHFHLETK